MIALRPGAAPLESLVSALVRANIEIGDGDRPAWLDAKRLCARLDAKPSALGDARNRPTAISR